MTQPSPKSGKEIGRPRSFSDADAFEAVLSAIKTHGYSQLTMNSIAKELACTGPALMSRFGSKVGLLKAFIVWGTRLTEEYFKMAVLNYESPIEALKSRFHSPEVLHSHEFGSQSETLNIFVFHAAAWSIPELREVELERRDTFARNMIAMLEDARSRGEVVGCDPQSLGRTMIAAIVGVALQWDSSPTGNTDDRIVAVIDELLRPYIVEKSSRPSGRDED